MYHIIIMLTPMALRIWYLLTVLTRHATPKLNQALPNLTKRHCHLQRGVDLQKQTKPSTVLDLVRRPPPSAHTVLYSAV
jgi:hypothetical protein